MTWVCNTVNGWKARKIEGDGSLERGFGMSTTLLARGQRSLFKHFQAMQRANPTFFSAPQFLTIIVILYDVQ